MHQFRVFLLSYCVVSVLFMIRRSTQALFVFCRFGSVIWAKLHASNGKGLKEKQKRRVIEQVYQAKHS